MINKYNIFFIQLTRSPIYIYIYIELGVVLVGLPYQNPSTTTITYLSVCSKALPLSYKIFGITKLVCQNIWYDTIW